MALFTVRSVIKFDDLYEELVVLFTASDSDDASQKAVTDSSEHVDALGSGLGDWWDPHPGGLDRGVWRAGVPHATCWDTRDVTNLWPQIIIAASTLAAALIGYTLAGRNEARRDRRAAESEKSVRSEERVSAAVQVRHEFQRETLLALQDAIQLMARLAGRAMHFDHMQARDGKYTQLPDRYSEEMHANGVDVNRLRTRVLDDGLRASVDRFRTASVEATLDPRRYIGLVGEDLERAAGYASMKFGEEVTRVMDDLGVALRKELAWLPN